MFCSAAHLYSPYKLEDHSPSYLIFHILPKLYQENIGLANGIVGEYLIEISDKIEVHLFKRALEIYDEKGKNNLGHILLLHLLCYFLFRPFQHIYL